MKKLNTLLEELLAEADSDAGEQAAQLKLVSKPFGNYADPGSGQVVAKSIQGHLVKIDPNKETPEDMSNGDVDAEPDDTVDPQSAVLGNEDKLPAHLAKIMSAAGGDMMKAQRALAKKAKEGNPSAQKWLMDLQTVEAKQKSDIRASLAAFDKKKADDLAAKKAKYSALYPSPQI